MDDEAAEYSRLIALHVDALGKRPRNRFAGAGKAEAAYDASFGRVLDACRLFSPVVDRLPTKVLRLADARLSRGLNLVQKVDAYIEGTRSPSEDDLREAGDDLENLAADLDAWRVAAPVADSRAGVKGLIEWANPYKEVVLIVLSVLGVVSFFATKAEMTEHIDRLNCVLNTRIAVLNLSDARVQDSLALERTYRELQDARRENAASEDIAELRARRAKLQERVDGYDRELSELQHKIDVVLSPTGGIKSCTV